MDITMRAINIFTVTRTDKIKYLRRYEKQMSGRDYYLPVKNWEIEGLRQLANHLFDKTKEVACLFFFYSFQIPKLGKEFDLLQISKDKVLNIELKSLPVEDEKIRRQLLLNRNYLALLGKDVYSFTYISSTDRLVRLTNSGRLVEADMEDLSKILKSKQDCICDSVEQLFGEEKYLLSPLSDPDRFLRRDYFLTSQQRDIRSKIIKNISKQETIQQKSAKGEVIKEGFRGKGFLVQGFTGFPGTGKTLLLYDLAMYYSDKQRVCILHFGPITDEMRRLDELLKRVDFVSQDEIADKMEGCALICVDEGHRMQGEFLEYFLNLTKEKQIPVVISYDDESSICPKERKWEMAKKLEEIPGYVKYSLTNRIRTNAPLSSFIRSMVHVTRNAVKRELPEVKLCYANDWKEAELFVKDFEQRGYIPISAKSEESMGQVTKSTTKVGVDVFCKEFQYVVMAFGDNLYYDEQGYLREKTEGKGKQVSRLFHGLNRAKKGVALVVVDNEAVFEMLLGILQGEE